MQLAVARFCAQRSELGVAERWFDTTARDELLDLDSCSINGARIYCALDQLGAHLKERYRQRIGVRFEFLLYDVTSTYFEGEVERNLQAQRDYSRDQQPGNKQVCIGPSAHRRGCRFPSRCSRATAQTSPPWRQSCAT